MRFGRIFWGLLLVLIGVLFLGSNMNWWSLNVFALLADFWPVLLVIIGTRIVFGEESPIPLIVLILAMAGIIAVAASPGLLKNSAFKQYSADIRENEEANQNTSFALNNASEANYDINIGAINFSIVSTDNADKLYEATFNSPTSLITDNSVKNGKANISVREEINRRWYRQVGERTLEMKLNPNIPSKLKIDSGASKFDFDLREIKVTTLDFNSGATSGKITLGSKENNVETTINAGASNFAIELPKDFGIQIISESALTSLDYPGITLEKEGNTYKSPGYDSSAKKLKLNVRAGATKVTLRQY
ncbi:MAG TPA: DUF5668 domain-containing protein [bacterium]|nr:DUF5668 domain-containing protein [bacterium]